MKKSGFLLLFVQLIFVAVFSQQADTFQKKMQWWEDARFGMFIHWGPVSLKGTEISWSRGREIPVKEYDNLYKQFDPVNFNADEWVRVAKEAGMKYIVLTTKHHDGFCLWNTRQTDYNIMNSPFGRDVVKELSEACRKQGIAFGAYYSTCDWHNPDFPITSPGGIEDIKSDSDTNYFAAYLNSQVIRPVSNLDAYTTYLKRQVGELLLNYGPLLTLWFDVPQRFDSIRGQGVIDFARTIQPDILINDRTGAKGDYDTPEQRIGTYQDDRPWETCMTIGDQWAWKPNDDVKSLEQCLQSLVRAAGGNGNLLFNVGPRPDGRIEPLQVQRLKEMGEWLKKYGFTIYGTRGGPYKPTDWGVSTRKGNMIYLHILNWCGNSPHLVLPDFGMEIKNCKLVEGGKVKYYKKDGKINITFSGKDLKPINTIVELEMAGDVMNVEAMETEPQSLSYRKNVSASSNPDPRWKGISFVNNGDWSGLYWSPSKVDKRPWAEIDLGKPEKVSEAVIFEKGNVVRSFEIQYKSGENWKTAYRGKTLGAKSEIRLPRFTAREVRLVITESSDTPEIYEITLLP